MRRSQVVPTADEDADYELPADAPYIPIEPNTTAAAEKAKLETLEAELARLRAEMAHFMQVQASTAPAPNAGVSPANSNRASSDYDGNSFEGEPQTPPRRPNFGAPPAGLSAPPPPPPPPTSSFAASLLQGHTALAAGNAAPAPSSAVLTASSSNPVPRTHQHSQSLSDMVKGSNRNSLRKVEGERSPGGTVKREQKISSNPSDMGDIIQQAMRRRFKSVSGSPDTKPTQSRVSTEPSDFDE
jgi:hypothetical protein